MMALSLGKCPCLGSPRLRSACVCFSFPVGACCRELPRLSFFPPEVEENLGCALPS